MTKNSAMYSWLQLARHNFAFMHCMTPNQGLSGSWSLFKDRCIVSACGLNSAVIWGKEKILYHRVQRAMLCTVIAAVFWSYFLSGNVWMSLCEHHYLVCRLALHSLCSAFISLFSRCLTLFSLPLCLAHMQGWGVWESVGWLICCTHHHCLTIFGLAGNPFFPPSALV